MKSKPFTTNPEHAGSVKFCLIQDEDCHWYVVPYSRKEEAENFFEEFYRLNRLYKETPEFPVWLHSVDGPRHLVFENWETT